MKVCWAWLMACSAILWKLDFPSSQPTPWSETPPEVRIFGWKVGQPGEGWVCNAVWFIVIKKTDWRYCVICSACISHSHQVAATVLTTTTDTSTSLFRFTNKNAVDLLLIWTCLIITEKTLTCETSNKTLATRKKMLIGICFKSAHCQCKRVGASSSSTYLALDTLCLFLYLLLYLIDTVDELL